MRNVIAAIIIASLASPAAAGPRRPIQDVPDTLYVKAWTKALAVAPGGTASCSRSIGRFYADALHRRCLRQSGSSSPRCRVVDPCEYLVEELKEVCPSSAAVGIACVHGSGPGRL